MRPFNCIRFVQLIVIKFLFIHKIVWFCAYFLPFFIRMIIWVPIGAGGGCVRRDADLGGEYRGVLVVRCGWWL